VKISIGHLLRKRAASNSRVAASASDIPVASALVWVLDCQRRRSQQHTLRRKRDLLWACGLQPQMKLVFAFLKDGEYQVTLTLSGFSKKLMGEVQTQSLTPT